jgi:hypothetical protein
VREGGGLTLLSCRAWRAAHQRASRPHRTEGSVASRKRRRGREWACEREPADPPTRTQALMHAPRTFAESHRAMALRLFRIWATRS